MTGVEPKWLHGVVRSLDKAGFKLRKAICMIEILAKLLRKESNKFLWIGQGHIRF